MPFIGSGENQKTKSFCCIKINDKWKLHHFDGEEWQRVNTGFPDDATECAPCAEFVHETGKWSLSFVAGGSQTLKQFWLYYIADLDNPNPIKIVPAAVGFAFKNRIAYALKNGALTIVSGKKSYNYTFADLLFFYRVSYNPQNPSEILMSGKNTKNEIFSWIFNPSTRTLSELTTNGLPAYKAAFWRGKLFYAKRGENESFEERHIVEADTYNLKPLDFDSIVSVEENTPSQTLIELVRRFTLATKRWAKSGFSWVDDSTLEHRTEICLLCPFWDALARMGMGKCKKCGCSSAKLKLASEKCPMGKW